VARLIVTLDVSSELRENIKSDIAPLLQIDSVTDVGLFSAEPPSYIQIIEEATRWSLLLKAAAGIFLTQLAKNAADDLWKHKSTIANALQSAAIWPIRKMVNALKRVREASPHSGLQIGIPVPDDRYEATVPLSANTIEDLAVTLAVFIWHAEEIERIVQKHGKNILGDVQICPESDGSVLLKWMNRDDDGGLKIVEVRLPFRLSERRDNDLEV
jgi:hypothetical protein